MRRSTRVTTQAAEENTSAHSEKGLLVGDENRLCEVAACDDLEEEVGVSVVVVEIPHLINREELRSGEAAQAPGQGGAGVLSGEFVEHVGGHGESGGEAAEDCVVEDVLDEHRLPDSVRTRRILPTIKAARRQSTTRSIRVAVSAWRLCVASDLAT